MFVNDLRAGLGILGRGLIKGLNASVEGLLVQHLLIDRLNLAEFGMHGTPSQCPNVCCGGCCPASKAAKQCLG